MCYRGSLIDGPNGIVGRRDIDLKWTARSNSEPNFRKGSKAVIGQARTPLGPRFARVRGPSWRTFRRRGRRPDYLPALKWRPCAISGPAIMGPAFKAPSPGPQGRRWSLQSTAKASRSLSRGTVRQSRCGVRNHSHLRGVTVKVAPFRAPSSTGKDTCSTRGLKS